MGWGGEHYEVLCSWRALNRSWEEAGALFSQLVSLMLWCAFTDVPSDLCHLKGFIFNFKVTFYS